jgi:UDP-2,3-diacylglucosamine hydrolase
MRCIFFSDTHLARKDDTRHALVEAFIRDVCANADMVFILGDLFEFYHGYEGYIFPWYRRIVDVLRDIALRGTAVYYLEGNHEFEMGPFFASHTRLNCTKSLAIEIEGKKIFLSHGDEITNAVLRKVLKSPITYAVMDALGPAVAWKIAMACRIFLSKRHRVYNEKVRDAFRLYAKQKLDEGYQAVILAHSHMPDLVEYGNGNIRKTYLNTGDLIENLSYGEYTTSRGLAIRIYEPGRVGHGKNSGEMDRVLVE